MIGCIEGRVVSVAPDSVTVLTESGVGYSVFSYTQHAVGAKLFLFTSHIIKENEQSLYGFNDVKSKELFEQLIKVNKVGPKLAFSVLSALGFEDTCQAIIREDVEVLKKVKGVGKAAASQIVLSLKEKIGSVFDLDEMQMSMHDNSFAGNTEEILNNDVFRDTREALLQLGFDEKIVTNLINDNRAHASTTEELVKAILQQTI